MVFYNFIIVVFNLFRKPEIIRAVQRKGWERPSIIQAASLPLVLTPDNNGVFKNLIAQAKNGAGKTGAFCLSLLLKKKDKKKKKNFKNHPKSSKKSCKFP